MNTATYNSSAYTLITYDPDLLDADARPYARIALGCAVAYEILADAKAGYKDECDARIVARDAIDDAYNGTAFDNFPYAEDLIPYGGDLEKSMAAVMKLNSRCITIVNTLIAISAM